MPESDGPGGVASDAGGDGVASDTGGDCERSRGKEGWYWVELVDMPRSSWNVTWRDVSVGVGETSKVVLGSVGCESSTRCVSS